ncbi:DNA replication protein [Salmonella enterica subsp. arizonae]|nr:DNA replication protein [Salmonella enterica subsp. arizonae]
MKNVGDLMQRLQKMMPAHITPAFKTGEELLAWQKAQGEIRGGGAGAGKPGDENAAHI